mgnify:FL=1
MELLRDKIFFIPSSVFRNMGKLGITGDEVVVLIFIINMGPRVLYDPEMISKGTGINRIRVLEVINGLISKGILAIVVKKNGSSKKMEEFISTDLFYEKMRGVLLGGTNRANGKKEEQTDLFSMFEKEFGRTLSSMEYEIIRGWVSDDMPSDLVREALREATYNGVSNLRYIEKIILDWKKRGYKSVKDIERARERYKKKNGNGDVFDYNWLDDE